MNRVSDRRLEVGKDAWAKNELMRSQRRHAKLSLRRRRDGRQDDLQRGERNAVAHHDEDAGDEQ